MVERETSLTADEQMMLGQVASMGDTLVARAVDWCAINSGSTNIAGLARVAAALHPALAALPGVVDVLPLHPTRGVAADAQMVEQRLGDALRLTVRPDAPIQVVLTGHYDTVYPETSPFQHVVTRGDGALHGPGIADMKGGLSVMLGALAAFERYPAAPRLGYRVLVSPDEEIGSPGSAPLLADIAEGAHIGLTYEPSLPDGRLVDARKGSGNFHIIIRGRAAHAGRDFASGRNAVAAAAALAAQLAATNGRHEGVTLNIARIDGGGPLNMVPDSAVLRFNVRVPDAAAGDWIIDQIGQACADIAAAFGVTTITHGGMTRAAKPRSAAQAALADAVTKAGADMGLAIGWSASGGVCEGNNLYAAGLPNIDTLGVHGGAIHSPDEYAWPASFVERAQLSALILARCATGTIDPVAIKHMMKDEQ